MKLLYITNGITGSGGLERVLSVKASLLADNINYEVHVMSLNEIGKKPFYSFSENITIHSVAVGGNLMQYFAQYKNKIQKIVTKIQPDIISVCDDGVKGFFLPQIIATNAKWIHESHASLLLGDKGTGVPFIKKSQHQLKQLLGKSFSKIVLLTEANKKEWSLENVVVIPNPLPFQSKAAAALVNKKVIAVGSYSYNKGYDSLLKIWTHLEKDFPDWELNIYGRDTYENLQPEAEKLNLKNIHFHAPVRNIENYYSEASLFVLPSRSEGFGMVLIEAMTCGLPVISFDCPNGPRDIISDKTDGFLIENGNKEDFAEKMKFLMNDEKLRIKMGNAGIEKAKMYDADYIVEKWINLFKLITK